LRKIIGGNTMAKEITKATGKDITTSFREIIIAIIGRIHNIARSVSSLPLVTDVR
jgi:hypothetical protein